MATTTGLAAPVSVSRCAAGTAAATARNRETKRIRKSLRRAQHGPVSSYWTHSALYFLETTHSSQTTHSSPDKPAARYASVTQALNLRRILLQPSTTLLASTGSSRLGSMAPTEEQMETNYSVGCRPMSMPTQASAASNRLSSIG